MRRRLGPRIRGASAMRARLDVLTFLPAFVPRLHGTCSPKAGPAILHALAHCKTYPTYQRKPFPDALPCAQSPDILAQGSSEVLCPSKNEAVVAACHSRPSKRGIGQGSVQSPQVFGFVVDWPPTSAATKRTWRPKELGYTGLPVGGVAFVGDVIAWRGRCWTCG